MNIQLKIDLPDEIVEFYKREMPEGEELNSYLSHLSEDLLQSLYECEQTGGPSANGPRLGADADAGPGKDAGER